MTPPEAASGPTLQRDPRRIQALFGGHSVADTTEAILVLEPGAAPAWYFPRRDVEMAVLQPTGHRPRPPWGLSATSFTIYRDAHVAEDAAWSFEALPEALLAIAGHIAFDPAQFDLIADGDRPAAWAAEHAARGALPAPSATRFASVADLADALRRASTAHARHEAEIGAPDPDWPDWYAAYLAAEQAPAPTATPLASGAAK